ncbi:MAG: DNA polymerase III subunit epsilon [Clostridium sp.]|nr:DNA polymerase III subunit epsilon [Clostridium sp.]
MNFTAIDFETANEKRNSACSIGITRVENNKIIDEKYFLIKPPEMRFLPQNIWIHNIYPEDVKDSKTFDEIWPEIKDYFEEELIIAHNASFDLSVLRNLLDTYNIEYPYLKYACTVILGQNHIEDVKNHKLNTLAEYVGHEFKHHHAGEDATACAKIMIYLCETLGIKDLLTLNLKGGITIGEIFPGGYNPCSSLIKRKNRISKEEAFSVQDINRDTDYFRDKVVVFTGPLNSMKRYEASSIIYKLGGTVGSSVTKKTEVLITGIKNREKMKDSYKSTKLRKAERLISEGQQIEILTEDEFLSLSLNK